MTPLDVRTIIRDVVTDPSENFWSEAEIYRYMSMGAREMILKFPELGQARTTVTAVVGQPNYSVTSTYPISINTVGYIRPGQSVTDNAAAETYQILKKIDPREQMWAMGDSSSTGEPQYYRCWDNPQTFLVYPSPDATGSFVVRYSEHDPSYSSTSTFSYSIEPYAHYLVDYCVMRMFVKDPELTSQGQASATLWREHLKDIETSLHTSNNRDRLRTVKDEDNYYYTPLGIA